MHSDIKMHKEDFTMNQNENTYLDQYYYLYILTAGICSAQKSDIKHYTVLDAVGILVDSVYQDFNETNEEEYTIYSQFRNLILSQNSLADMLSTIHEYVVSTEKFELETGKSLIPTPDGIRKKILGKMGEIYAPAVENVEQELPDWYDAIIAGIFRFPVIKASVLKEVWHYITPEKIEKLNDELLNISYAIEFDSIIVESFQGKESSLVYDLLEMARDDGWLHRDMLYEHLAELTKDCEDDTFFNMMIINIRNSFITEAMTDGRISETMDKVIRKIIEVLTD